MRQFDGTTFGMSVEASNPAFRREHYMETIRWGDDTPEHYIIYEEETT